MEACGLLFPRKGVYRFKDYVLTSFGRRMELTDNSIWALFRTKEAASGQASTGLFHWNEGHGHRNRDRWRVLSIFIRALRDVARNLEWNCDVGMDIDGYYPGERIPGQMVLSMWK